MSHYIVMVIGDEPDNQLAPFDKNLDAEIYCAEELSDEDKQQMLDFYTQEGHRVDSFEACYERFGEDWNNNRWHPNEDGVWCEYYWYNPDSKWDWYVLGGRWSGKFIRLKADVESGIYGVSGAFGNVPGIDAARKGDIDFDAIRSQAAQSARRAYRLVLKRCKGRIPKLKHSFMEIEQKNSHLPWEKIRSIYNNQRPVKKWNKWTRRIPGYPQIEDFQCSEEEYVARSEGKSFIPYAYVKDGKWYACGDMGAWGISSNECPKHEWEKQVWDMINALPDDTWISFYDCHI